MGPINSTPQEMNVSVPITRMERTSGRTHIAPASPGQMPSSYRRVASAMPGLGVAALLLPLHKGLPTVMCSTRVREQPQNPHMTVGRSMATHYAKYPVGVERLPTIVMSRRDADGGPSV